MRNIVLAFVVAFAVSTTAMAADIAISTQAGWFGQAAADREMQEIVDNVTAVAVERFAADQQAALADWVVAHTGDGVGDLLIVCGQLPDTIYPAGNAQPDGSLAELFLDDGNTIVNTGDWIFYVVNSSGANGPGGLQNMMDIPGVTVAGEDNTAVTVIAEGRAVAPSLQDFQTDRPFHLDTLAGDWVPELILAQNAAGTRADPVIVVNTVTGGRIGIFYQTSGQDNDPRGEVMSEWINNYFLTGGAIPNGPAWGPNPADGAIEVDTTALEWAAGYGAVSHNVYLSTDATIDDADLLGQTDLTIQVAILDPGTTYYWQVDEVDADGNVVEGDVWSFSTLPLEAHLPSPYDGAMWRGLGTQLSWTPGKNAIMHNVHWGTDPAMLMPVSMMQMATSYNPGALNPDTTYYWRVDEFTPLGTVAGPVWSFTTVNPDVGGVVAEYWANRYLDGPPALVTTESEVNFDFNAQRGSQPHPDVPVVDNFSCRWSAELQVPVTGTYTLYEASDDGSRMFLNGVQVAAGWWDRGTTEDTTGPLELVAGERYLLVMEMYENGGGATAYLRWQGPGMPKEIIPQGALMPPQMAFSPSPSNGATGLGSMPTLSWMAGDSAILYDVYLSKNEALVAAGDASVLMGRQPETSYAVADALGRGTTWFWKVDVVTADGTVLPGLVSSFRIADENTDNWVQTNLASPDFVATYVQNGPYDIGTFGGEMTYEFIVQSNPDETQVSMALIGRIGHGDTRVALKYEQWNNTGLYGATVFGVMDYDFGVPTAPGEYTHLVFVSSETAGTTELYVNGELAGSVPAAITLSGIVGIGEAIRDPEGVGVVDPFDGTIFGVAIYDRALSADEIATNADKYFTPIAITDPDMLLYLDFESGSGGTALDQSGHGNHGVLMGDSQWTTGIFGGAMDFDGDGDYVDCGNDTMFDITDAFSLSVWINWRATGATWQTVVAKGDNSWRLARGGDTQTMDFGFTAGGTRGWQAARTASEVPLGEWHNVVATYNTTDGAKIYLDGVLEGTNPDTGGITVGTYPVLIGENPQAVGRYWNGLVDEVRVYSKTLTGTDIQRMVMSDVTAPGDTIQGVPNDGDWPGGEYPALAIDDSSGTKYLHRKGGSMATGFQVEPAVGATIVTGLTFTTANDTPTRDPITFELSGSNESIDGPYEVIAVGDIVDFAQAGDWPRFTMNATAISFENATAYKYYQIVFPTLRGATQTLMQIAEVELLGVVAPLYVEDFESYAAGDQLHGVGGWAGWGGDAGAGAPVSSAFASSGANSVEVVGAADLVQEFDVAGGVWTFSAMQYIPSGTTGTTYFILLNQYGAANDWSIQTTFNLGTGAVGFWHGGAATIVYDQWVELKYVIDLDNNTVDKYYNGAYVVTDTWDDNVHGTLGAIDLYGNGASSVFYDDIVLVKSVD